MRDPFEWPGRDDFESDDTVTARAKRTLEEFADPTGIEWIIPEAVYASEPSDDADDSAPATLVRRRLSARMVRNTDRLPGRQSRTAPRLRRV